MRFAGAGACIIAFGGTSASVDTGSAGASNNTPRIHLDFNLGSGFCSRFFDPNSGVHFTRTIKQRSPIKSIDIIVSTR